VALHLAGKRDEALKELERAVAGGDASPEMHRAIGHIRFELGDYREAARSYQSLAQLKPNYAMGWFNLAVCLERLGDWEEASEAFQKTCSLDRKSTRLNSSHHG
jgi:Flp pilus assembly protein TadD